jgi:hypothetical protein
MALTPQELAALQAGIDLGGVNTYGAQPPLENVTLKGRRSVPGTSQPFLSDVDITQQNLRASRMDKAKGAAQDALMRTRVALGQLPETLQNIPMGRIGLGLGMISPAFTAVEEAQAGRPTGALGALGVGAAGVGTGALLARMLPGPYGKIASAVLPAIGGIIGAAPGASLAESVKRSLTGDPITGKDDLKNQLAERGLISKQDLDIYDRTQGIQTSNILNLNQGFADQAIS